MAPGKPVYAGQLNVWPWNSLSVVEDDVLDVEDASIVLVGAGASVVDAAAVVLTITAEDDVLVTPPSVTKTVVYVVVRTTSTALDGVAAVVVGAGAAATATTEATEVLASAGAADVSTALTLEEEVLVEVGMLVVEVLVDGTTAFLVDVIRVVEGTAVEVLVTGVGAAACLTTLLVAATTALDMMLEAAAVLPEQRTITMLAEDSHSWVAASSFDWLYTSLHCATPASQVTEAQVGSDGTRVRPQFSKG